MASKLRVTTFVSVCPDPAPSINNGDIDSGDTAPYFINEVITYTCNDGFMSESSPIINTCQVGSGPNDLMWSTPSSGLSSTCIAGIVNMHRILMFNKFKSI